MRITHAVLESIIVLSLIGGASASEKSLADALATAGTAHHSAGHLDQAKDLLFKALAYDSGCPAAIFELAKIYEQEGDVASAADFYKRAATVYAYDTTPESVTRHNEAEKRAKLLNPFAPRLQAALEEFSQDLDRLARRNDPLIIQLAGDQVKELDLAAVLPSEKIPKFYAAYEAQQRALAAAQASASEPSSKPKNDIPSDVEKELTRAGWQKITGTWVRKGPHAFEVTDGKLESDFKNGAMDFTIVKNETGAVRATVRTSFNKRKGPPDRPDRPEPPGFNNNDSLSGYGFSYQNRECRIYEPNEGGGRGFGGGGGGGGGGGPGRGFNAGRPSFVSSYTLPDGGKNRFMLSAADNTLDVFINDKRNAHSSSAHASHNGPMVIEFEGTVTVENPRCSGQ